MYRYRIVFLVNTSVAGTLEALSDHFYALRGCSVMFVTQGDIPKGIADTFRIP